MSFSDCGRRAEALLSWIRGRSLDACALFCFEEANWESLYYLSGFRGSAGAVLVGHPGACLIVDGRYTAQARSQSPFEVLPLEGRRLFDVVAERLRKWGARRVGLEASRLTHAEWLRFGECVAGRLEIEDVSEALPAIRRRKDESERRLLREATRLAEEAFGRTLARTGPGMSEREFAALLEYEIRLGGAEGGWGRDFVVVSGPRTALPHGVPTDRRFAPGEWVTVDFGARQGGYVSDITRNFCFGPPDPLARDLHERVLAAQAAAASRLRPGASGVEVDAAARSVLEEAGHGEAFSHGTGHGIGLELHEAPRLSCRSEEILTEGDVVTVEPGVYYEGRGGVRIEDDYLITADGATRLTGFPRDLVVL